MLIWLLKSNIWSHTNVTEGWSSEIVFFLSVCVLLDIERNSTHSQYDKETEVD